MSLKEIFGILYIKFLEKFFKDIPYEITFTGGMGAQIISAALYMKLISEGRRVFADLSYFDREFDDTKPCTHWNWAISSYGYDKDSFKQCRNHRYTRIKVRDGLWKFNQGILALSHKNAQEWFMLKNADVNRLIKKIGDFRAQKSLVLHIRRGDFVKLDSYTISDKKIIRLLKNFSGIMDDIYILSDEVYTEDSEIFIEIKKLYKSVYFIPSSLINEYESHIIMRSAKNLIVANSQFSITAGVLNNNDGLKIFPKGIVKEEGCHFNKVIISKSDFYII
jgi:hypothetical protein